MRVNNYYLMMKILNHQLKMRTINHQINMSTPHQSIKNKFISNFFLIYFTLVYNKLDGLSILTELYYIYYTSFGALRFARVFVRCQVISMFLIPFCELVVSKFFIPLCMIFNFKSLVNNKTHRIIYFFVYY